MSFSRVSPPAPAAPLEDEPIDELPPAALEDLDESTLGHEQLLGVLLAVSLGVLTEPLTDEEPDEELDEEPTLPCTLDCSGHVQADEESTEDDEPPAEALPDVDGAELEGEELLPLIVEDEFISLEDWFALGLTFTLLSVLVCAKAEPKAPITAAAVILTARFLTLMLLFSCSGG